MIETAPLYFMTMSVAAQAIALGATISISRAGFFPDSPFLAISIQAVVAFFVARLLKLSGPWQLLNLVLVPAIFVFQALHLPHWVALLGVIVSLVIYVPTFWTRVPFYPTSSEMYSEILRRLPENKEFSFIDLGCGYGTMLMHLAKHRPLGRFYGAEIAPLPYLVARFRALISRKRVEVSFQSFWNLDLGQFDVVYAFLAPAPMPALWEKIQKESKAGSLFLVNTFKVDAAASEQITVKDKRNCVLYVYRR